MVFADSDRADRELELRGPAGGGIAIVLIDGAEQNQETQAMAKAGWRMANHLSLVFEDVRILVEIRRLS
jgi:hypothetical protein